ncbi:SDR family oxidoreductase [Kosakonia sp. ML.JS2a]|jgi:3-oxoacyl-[acyl-carrier protein] reductase/meso-butanediol dehydrogenase/(S,S)-butanediol dehydrogenase/diacetyl reductase|uniref:SDR family NAD(P)-dependent oxidoreductase n=1 Tax=Kosakonia sp. ML.JS2a TaxID=2980557 RepID=UPI0021DAE4BF|nr:SDR family NAD(P)-dependent oxidoreductase [Kosakonia sp. ML.JS2a]UXY11560.1 SDR family oxidoreductase [Kosakonia sp. ML.JS2a]
MIALDFSGQTAVVSGGLQGIGKAIADLLHIGGANVVVGDIAVVKPERDRRYVVQPCDVASRTDAQALITTAREVFGGVDILVNSCGVSAMSPVDAMQERDWQRILDVNVKGLSYLSEAAIRIMKTQRAGRIINIASQAGKNGYRLMGQYVASKHAVLGLTRVMAIELAQHNILVNAVCPGIVETEMKWRERQQGAALRGLTADDIYAEDCSQVLLGRTAQPLDVANVVAFLASPLASYMTGQAINVTGGMTMH